MQVKELIENTYSNGERIIIREDKMKFSSIDYIVLRPENDAENIVRQSDYENIKTISLNDEFAIDIFFYEGDLPVWDDEE